MNMTTSPSPLVCTGQLRPGRAGRFPRLRSGRGFTLIEILVVVGIIVVLVSVLVPLVGRAMRQAKQTRTAADMASIGTALEAFKADHGDYPRVGTANTGAAVLARSLFGPYGNGTLPTGTLDDQDPPAYNAATAYLPGDTVRNPSGDINDPTYVRVVPFAPTTVEAPSATSVFWAQIAANDGIDGPGLQMRTGGKKWGPYLQEGKFKFRGLAVLDGNDNPILYFPARPGKTNINVQGGYLPVIDKTSPLPATNDGSLYDTFDNWIAFKRPSDLDDEPAQWRMHAMLGDRRMNAGTVQDGGIVTPPTSDEVAAYEGPYILWAAGPDGFFGPDDITNGDSDAKAEANRKVVDRCDDVTNFGQ